MYPACATMSDETIALPDVQDTTSISPDQGKVNEATGGMTTTDLAEVDAAAAAAEVTAKATDAAEAEAAAKEAADAAVAAAEEAKAEAAAKEAAEAATKQAAREAIDPTAISTTATFQDVCVGFFAASEAVDAPKVMAVCPKLEGTCPAVFSASCTALTPVGANVAAAKMMTF